MTRPLRLEYPGALYHITARGNAQQDIYLDDADRAKFLDLLAKEIRQQGWLCHAYCLMTNHHHLLIETPEANLSKGMRRLNGSYTQTFNRRHGRVGHLFQGRYKSILVDKQSYLLELCRYLVLNPVRADMVPHPQDWPWSSYRATRGDYAAPDWLTSAWVLSQFSEYPQNARLAYQQFVEEGGGKSSPWDKLKGQIWLGSDAFRKQMEQLIREKPVENIASAQLKPTRPSAERILRDVAITYQTDLPAVINRKHKPAYQTAVYLLRRVANQSLKEVAEQFSISITRVSHIQRSREDASSDPLLDILTKRYNINVPTQEAAKK